MALSVSSRRRFSVGGRLWTVTAREPQTGPAAMHCDGRSSKPYGVSVSFAQSNQPRHACSNCTLASSIVGACRVLAYFIHAEISSFSWAIRSRNCARWPVRAVLRVTVSPRRPPLSSPRCHRPEFVSCARKRYDRRSVVALGEQPRLPGHQFIELRAHDAKSRNLSVTVSSRHTTESVPRQPRYLTGTARPRRRRMLHLLHVQFDHDRAGRNYSTG